MPSLYELLKAPKDVEKTSQKRVLTNQAWQRESEPPTSRVPETVLHRRYRLNEIEIDQYLREREQFRNSK